MVSDKKDIIILGNESRIKGIYSTLANEQLYRDGNEGLCLGIAFDRWGVGGWRKGSPVRKSSWKDIRDIVTMQMRKAVVFGWFMGLVKGVTFQLVGKE